MGRIIELVIAAVLILLLWWLGWTAGHQTVGEFSASSFLLAIILAVLLLLAIASALLSAISLYTPKTNTKVRFELSNVLAIWNPSKSQVIGHAALSYAATIYLFSIIFLWMSKYDIHSFMPAISDLGTAVYFSIVTIATVGYGDFVPASGWARVVVSAEILIGLAYVVFFFSVFASFLREDYR